MTWPENLDLGFAKLLSPATAADVARVEQVLGLRLSAELTEFLYVSDGGIIGNFIIYSAGKGLHPDETLIAANSDREPDFPILAVGSDASYEFGFKKKDLSHSEVAVYFHDAETGRLTKAAPSFRTFIENIAKLKPGEAFRIDRDS